MWLLVLTSCTFSAGLYIERNLLRNVLGAQFSQARTGDSIHANDTEQRRRTDAHVTGILQ